ERGGIKDFAYALIPVLADAIVPDPEMAKLIAGIRAPHGAMLATELARTDALLYRRDTFTGTLDRLICDAVAAERDAEIAFSPGFRWGPTLLPGQAITWEDIYDATAITYPAVYRTTMTGAQIKATLEAVADNLLNPDPYLQQGGDMVRVGGLGFTVHVDAAPDQRIANLRLLRTGLPVEPGKSYIVAGWASVNEGTQGPPVWDVVAAYLKGHTVVAPSAADGVGYVRSAH
ncbi:MAG TPA: 5'-nucleotidase C-terminal domain-containing protein, partial [Hyphomicrobiaceae bacterium]|nr:5'-nucleotidase C-terminal domain-containing protein [Hyphomicrobiaceae bacterium]